jgi:hypothetical protein
MGVEKKGFYGTTKKTKNGDGKRPLSPWLMAFVRRRWLVARSFIWLY